MLNFTFGIIQNARISHIEGPALAGVTLVISDPDPAVGDNVHITCHVSNTPTLRFFPTWVKRTVEGDTEIGTNRYIDPNFRDRYTSTMGQYSADGSFTVTLTIHGNYLCILSSIQK